MTDIITIDDLDTTLNHEPRIQDLLVAERLGYDRPRVVRELIERNQPELTTYGSLAVRHGKSRGQEFTEYYLNEGQALVICALSRTPKAAEVRKAIIEVFMAWRGGQLRPHHSPGDFPAMFATREIRSAVNRRAFRLSLEAREQYRRILAAAVTPILAQEGCTPELVAEVATVPMPRVGTGPQAVDLEIALPVVNALKRMADVPPDVDDPRWLGLCQLCGHLADTIEASLATD